LAREAFQALLGVIIGYPRTDGKPLRRPNNVAVSPAIFARRGRRPR